MKRDEKPPSCKLNMREGSTCPYSLSGARIASCSIKNSLDSSAILAIDNKNRYIFDMYGSGYELPFGFCWGYGSESMGKFSRYILEDGY
ncbi:MAG: hypothetical protein GWN61_17455 [candidate division Zixibacteria bacterium]|nr:hypothetical protein [candidate division Zixibacteria bacterium]NIR66027.1 hypothetical protein [candidate division Zixibacteria bacterium]NIV07908.1 hypothetical protein [candidate division Zixibacteria bacterium]